MGYLVKVSIAESGDKFVKSWEQKFNEDGTEEQVHRVTHDIYNFIKGTIQGEASDDTKYAYVSLTEIATVTLNGGSEYTEWFDIDDGFRSAKVTIKKGF